MSDIIFGEEYEIKNIYGELVVAIPEGHKDSFVWNIIDGGYLHPSDVKENKLMN